MAKVRASGAKYRGELIELRVRPTPEGALRVGLVVPRHRQTAVERNKVKRRLREVLRQIRVTTPLQGDAIVVAGPRAYGATFDTLCRELTAIWARAASRASRVDSK